MNCLFGSNSCTWVLILVVIFLLTQNNGCSEGASCGTCSGTCGGSCTSCGCGCGCS